MDFSKFKKNRKNVSKAIDNMKAKKPSYVDERFWALTVDDSFNGEAIIRFLPQQDPEASPVIMYYNHFFKKNGQWFNENCPFTNGKDCPVCDYVQPFWEEDTEASKNEARKYSRGKNYVANIQVIKDPAKPENNGKVFLFRFGVKIYDKLLDKVAPESELEEPVMVHDLWEGQNFLLKCRKKDGYRNYDTSKFYDKLCPVAKSDKGIEEIYNQIKVLDEFVEDKKFKKYEEIQKKFFKIMKIKNSSTKIPPEEKSLNDTIEEEEFNFDDDENEVLETETEETPEEDKNEVSDEKVEETEDSSDDDDENDFNFDFDSEDDIPF